MTHNEIIEAIGRLDGLCYQLEREYTENGGEVTDQTEEMELQATDLRALLCTEGADALGRWLKAKEDERAAAKAEKDYITRRMERIDRTTAYIKGLLHDIMAVTGTDQIKGAAGYVFKPYTSEKVEVNKEALVSEYGEAVEKARKAAGLPEWVTVTLGASIKALPEGTPLPDYMNVVKTDTVRFTKPRASRQ